MLYLNIIAAISTLNMSNIPDDESMSDDVFEDQEITQRRIEERRRLDDIRWAEAYEYNRVNEASGYPGFRPAREALQLYALDDHRNEIEDDWRSYRYEEVDMVPPQPQPFADNVNHKVGF